ncbi:MAG: lipoprotein [Steroidobacteraceae bacterium]
MRFVLAVVTTCVLCACGQKGALYLPDRERETVPAGPLAPAASPDASPAPAAAASPTADTTTADDLERKNAARTNRN